MKRVTDRDFVYVSADKTDVAMTFRAQTHVELVLLHRCPLWSTQAVIVSAAVAESLAQFNDVAPPDGDVRDLAVVFGRAGDHLWCRCSMWVPKSAVVGDASRFERRPDGSVPVA